MHDTEHGPGSGKRWERHAGLTGEKALIDKAGTARREPFLEIIGEHRDRMVFLSLRGLSLVGQAVGADRRPCDGRPPDSLG